MVFIGYVFFLFQWGGKVALKIVLVEGPGSNIRLTMLMVGIAWLLIGSILFLLSLNVINRRNIFSIVTFYLFSFMYLNILRERLNYGDVGDYIKAAKNLSSGVPFHNRYLYPPLWATLLQPLVPFGDYVIFLICFLANYFSLLLFYFLLMKILVRYDYSTNFSALIVFSILCVNVPLLRTLGYVQVNLHVANLILLSLLYYRNNIFLSALALSLAVHLKISPIILILPMIVNKDWRYIAYFATITLGLVIFTSLMNGMQYYSNFLTNISNIYSANGINFRDNSIDSFIRATFTIAKLNLNNSNTVISIIKLFICVLSIGICYRCVKNKTFYSGIQKEEVLYNSCIVLMFLMTILSPIIWEHHPVFIIFPFLIILKRLFIMESIIIYIIAYLFIFLIPTFDFYPFSYHRLLGMILCYIIFIIYLKDSVNKVVWFDKINHRLSTI